MPQISGVNITSESSISGVNVTSISAINGILTANIPGWPSAGPVCDYPMYGFTNLNSDAYLACWDRGKEWAQDQNLLLYEAGACGDSAFYAPDGYYSDGMFIYKWSVLSPVQWDKVDSCPILPRFSDLSNQVNTGTSNFATTQWQYTKVGWGGPPGNLLISFTGLDANPSATFSIWAKYSLSDTPPNDMEYYLTPPATWSFSEITNQPNTPTIFPINSNSFVWLAYTSNFLPPENPVYVDIGFQSKGMSAPYYFNNIRCNNISP